LSQEQCWIFRPCRSDLGAEFLFQVIAERAEKAAVIMTTNLPFSEWTQVIPNARLCKALLDRITDRAHTIETGADRSHSGERSRKAGPNPWLLDALAGLRPSATLLARRQANLYPTTLFSQAPQVVQSYKISCQTHVGDRAIPVLSIDVFIRLGPAFSR
jgi:hypothetical protein